MLCLALVACAPTGPAGEETMNTFPELRGPYLGQEPPGLEPEIFAPGVVSTGLATRDVAMMPDGEELYFSVTVGGRTMIMVSRTEDGVYTDPELLGSEVNCGSNRFNVYVSPDETFVIVPAMGREDSLGGVDYYVVFRSDDDTWSEPINMGEAINQPEGREWSASLSPDGKYLFFMTSRAGGETGLPLTGRSISDLLDISSRPGQGSSDIWWVSAEVIERLRP
jgi:Tol biopolymer transport system component